MKHVDLNHIKIIESTIRDYPLMQNMARFYVYDMSRDCGFISSDWACPENGLYESFDIKIYFEDPRRKAFLVRASEELAGFVLLHQIGTQSQPIWFIGEFFILGKFQGKGVAAHVAKRLWEKYPGSWQASVIPENTRALAFWRKIIAQQTHGNYLEEIRRIDYDKDQPNRYFFSFDVD